MEQVVNTKFRQDLIKFGAKNDWNDCFHCGNCTAVCSLSEDHFNFPRKTIRQAQMGLTDSLSKNIDPWLCYYCGECTETCPRDANPGELMMSLRRYLTSVYDWTGLSRKFYKSHRFEYGAIAFLALFVIAIFVFLLPPAADLFSNKLAYLNEQGGVKINHLTRAFSGENFVSVIELGDWAMALIAGGLLITNILNMFFKVVLNDKNVRIPFYAFFTEAWQLVWNFATQSKFAKCEDKKTYWVGHLLLMTGYSAMFAIIVVLLPKFQVEEIVPWYNWQRLLGYYATFGIIFFLVIVTIKRLKARETNVKFSHLSDWLFIILLFGTCVSGILIHFFRIGGLPGATYITYVIHLAILFPMIIIEVPFSKWSHLAYRPFAIYFARLKKHAYIKEIQRNTAMAV